MGSSKYAKLEIVNVKLFPKFYDKSFFFGWAKVTLQGSKYPRSMVPFSFSMNYRQYLRQIMASQYTSHNFHFHRISQEIASEPCRKAIFVALKQAQGHM